MSGPSARIVDKLRGINHISGTNSYAFDQYLGEGVTSCVMVGHDLQSYKKVAIKVIEREILAKSQDLQEKTNREIAVMALVDHPNIIKLYEVIETEELLFIVLEYAENRTLFDYLYTKRFITEKLALEFIRQVVLGLEYLHCHGICHRDLKPENVFLDSNLRVKIGDFGFAKGTADGFLAGCRGSGSLHYAAPEVIDQKPYNGFSADIWSVGVMFFCLLARYLPFDDQSPSRLVQKIRSGRFSMPEFREEVRNLISKMLVVDPKERITIESIKQHKCFRSGLPEGYILPVPIPCDSKALLMNGTIFDVVIEVLKTIGYSSRDRFRQLLESSAEYSTTLKAFIDTCRRENMPWKDWESKQLTLQLSKQVTDDHWKVLADLQMKLNNAGFTWIHPSEQLIFFKGNDTYGMITCQMVEKNQLSISVYLSNAHSSDLHFALL